MIFYTKIINHQLYSDRDSITKVSNSFTNDFGTRSTAGGSVSLIKLSTNSSAAQNRRLIRDSVQNVNIKTMGRNFLAIISFENMEVLMEIAKSRDLVDTKNQWLYVISSAEEAKNKTDRRNVKKFLREGDNVSFMYNTTVRDESCKVIRGVSPFLCLK